MTATRVIDKLGVQIEALQAQRESLDSDPTEKAPSVKRIAALLRPSLELLEDHDHMLEVVDGIATAADQELGLLVDQLLEALRERARQENKDVENALVLVIDDDPIVRKICERRLASSSQAVLCAGDLDQARELLSQNSISLILLDLVLPNADGRDFLVELKQGSTTKDIPVFLLSGKEDKSTQAECFALGGESFFQKPFEPDVLAAAVRSALVRRQRNKNAARRDVLTGLDNRASFKDIFERAKASAQRSKTQLSVAMIDLDRLEKINEAHGRKFGDQALKHVVKTVAGCLRKSDVLARWDGAELVVLFPETDSNGASEAMSKSLKALRDTPLEADNGSKIALTFSGGVADVAPEMGADDAIAEANKHLYRAKTTGRIRVLSHKDTAHLPELPKKLILLAEDDVVTSKIIVHRFKREDIEIIHKDNGADAYEVLTQQPVSLVLSDVMMPKMDGFELLNKIREHPKHKHTPVIMLTSLGNENDIAKALSSGANDYVVKPFSPVELISRVHRILRDKQPVVLGEVP